MLKRLSRLILKGLADDEYTQIDKEIEAFVDIKAAALGMQREAQIKQIQAVLDPEENVPGTDSEPDMVNAASLAAAGALITETY